MQIAAMSVSNNVYSRVYCVELRSSNGVHYKFHFRIRSMTPVETAQVHRLLACSDGAPLKRPPCTARREGHAGRCRYHKARRRENRHSILMCRGSTPGQESTRALGAAVPWQAAASLGHSAMAHHTYSHT